MTESNPITLIEESMEELLSGKTLAIDIIERLSRIESSVSHLIRTVDGNGVPGLIDRVNVLESVEDNRKGGNSMKARWMGAAMSVVIALLGGVMMLMIQYNNRSMAQQDAMNVYLQKQDSRIQSTEINVAVLLEQMKGAPGETGAKGKPGKSVKGEPGEQGKPGAKGGVKLF